jgi:hypothetical protein
MKFCSKKIIFKKPLNDSNCLINKDIDQPDHFFYANQQARESLKCIILKGIEIVDLWLNITLMRLPANYYQWLIPGVS